MTDRNRGRPSQIGFGCAHLMRLPRRKDRLLLLEEAFSQGIRHYDVARSYGLGAAERDVGRFIRNKRDDVVIATKFGLPLPRVAPAVRVVQGPLRSVLQRLPRANAAARTIPAAHTSAFRFDPHLARTSLETSMRLLGVDYVDIYFMHEPFGAAFEAGEVIELMEELKALGHIKAWGVAGYPAPLHDVVARFTGSEVVVQTLWDALADSVPPVVQRADIVFGVLTSALPAILAHTQATQQTLRRWHDETGLDCGNADELAVVLLEAALRSRSGRIVLMSTTRRSRLRVARLAHDRASAPPRAELGRIQHLVASELRRTA